MEGNGVEPVMVLEWMLASAQGRAMFCEMLHHDLERWHSMESGERLKAFDRHARRFSALCPLFASNSEIAAARKALLPHRVSRQTAAA